MLNTFETTETTIKKTNLVLPHDIDICQVDYPLDWYQQEFTPYAEEYAALPDRKLETILPWMEGYIKPAIDHFGDSLILLAHYYMGGEIVKMIEHFGGCIGDSYQLALMATRNPEKKVIVESAVHFMAESISILARPDQQVYITNPKSGCTMEMMAKDYMVEPAITALNERYGDDHILPISYMNTSGRIKAMTGAQGGAVCTSSNVKKIFQWALKQNKKILFIPDQHMGENVAGWCGIRPDEIAYWPAGAAALQFSLNDPATQAQFDKAKLVLFSSFCGVHTYYQPEMVSYWQERGFNVVAHPECRKVVVDIADHHGSTAFIWDHVSNDKAGTKKYAIATEGHMVDNVIAACKTKGIQVVNVSSAEVPNKPNTNCGCATMSRNDPPHLVAILDLLRQGKAPSYNQVQAGDVVNEFSGSRQRLNDDGQTWLKDNARIALENMIRITEA